MIQKERTKTTAEPNPLDPMIERLRLSRAECEEADMMQGREAGEAWAKDQASWKELELLIEAGDGLIDELTREFFLNDRPCIHYWPTMVLDAIDPDGAEDREFDEVAAWFEAEGSCLPSRTWLHGFILGAAALYGQVQTQV